MNHPSLLFMNAGVLTATRLGPVARTPALKPPFANIYMQPSLWPGARHDLNEPYIPHDHDEALLMIHSLYTFN